MSIIKLVSCIVVRDTLRQGDVDAQGIRKLDKFKQAERKKKKNIPPHWASLRFRCKLRPTNTLTPTQTMDWITRGHRVVFN